MKDISFDFSDVVFGWDDNGFWFQCDHALNYDAFIFFIKHIRKVMVMSYENFKKLEDNVDG